MSFLPVQRVLDTAIQSRFLDSNAKKVVGVGLALTALHVVSALTAVAYNAQRGLYKNNHFDHEYKPTTPRQYAFKDLGAYLMLDRLINKISSLFKTQTPPPQLEIRAVSWNLSGHSDMIKALEDDRAAVNENTPEPESEEKYKKASIAHMNKIIDGFGPDIILMQELAGQKNENRYEHTPLLDLLRTNGYRIYAPGNGPAVAFKEKAFDPCCIPDPLRDGSAYIKLRHKATGQAIGAVSDHLAGFNSTQYNESLDSSIVALTQTGDGQLYRIVEPLRNLGNQNDILVIYGVDSNTTPPGVWSDDPNHKTTLHPERLGPLISFNFVRDEVLDKQEHPTIVDHNSKLHLKFDHIFCFHQLKRPQVTRQIIENINGPQLLQKKYLFTTEGTGSDHLPVMAIITLPKPQET